MINIARRIILLSLFTARVSAFVPSTVSSASSETQLRMSEGGGGLIDAANFAVKQAPASTKFVTNKMCPFAQKVWIALEVSQAPYEMKEISLYGPNGKPDWFWDLNPQGTVPVLVCHGGAVVYPDSDLALDQIENGSALLGEGGSGGFSKIDTKKDKTLMSNVKSWRDDINNKLLPIGKKAVLGGSKQKLFDVLKEMDAKVTGPYLCGEQVTSADCAAFPFLWRLNDEYGLNDYDNLKDWLKTCESNMAFKKTIQSAWWWWW